MITQTPRADPTPSASSPMKRNAPSQPRVPITPNRYRSPSSVHHAFPSTPPSRSASVVESTEHSPLSHGSTSNWQASIELSLTTRRRLIRKPLPQIPTSHFHHPAPADANNSGLVHSSLLDSQYQNAESWWPDALPEKHTTSASTFSRFGTATQPTSSRFDPQTDSKLPHQQQVTEGQGLDQQSLRHLLSILHHAALRYASNTHMGLDDGTVGRSLMVSATGTYKKQSNSNIAAAAASGNVATHSLYVLDEATLESLYEALQAAFRHLSQKQVLGALQRTASIRWRAEAQLRNATATQAAEANSGLSSRWARFAWPAAALGRAYKEAHKNVLLPLSGDVPSSGLTSGSHLQMSHDLYSNLYSDPDHRLRKRDVAVKILSNAIWFVRNYGPVAGVESLEASNAQLDEKHATSSATHDLPPPSMSSVRRTSESLLKTNAGLPTFLPKSSATTALSGTATPESGQSDVLEAVEKPSYAGSTGSTSPAPLQHTTSIALGTPSPQLPTTPEQATLDSVADTTLKSPETGIAASSETGATSAGQKSKAMEHLASLSAAAGAAMRQRAQQAAVAAAANGDKPEDAIDAAVAAPGSLHPQSSRPSFRSFVSRSEAEAAETDALEKAEHDHLTEIGQGCDEWAKMVVCRLCASIQVANPSEKGRHRRSGTLTARDFGKIPAAIEDTSAESSISTRSDMTAKAGKVGHGRRQHGAQLDADTVVDNESGEPVVWKPDVFEGDELFARHAASSHERKGSVSPRDEDQRVRLVGGSFICRVQNEEEREALTELLEIALHVGMSMLLESSFLSDSDAARPKVAGVPARSTSAVDAPQRGTSLIRQPVLSRASPQQSLTDGQRSVSGSSTREALVETTVAEAHEAETNLTKPGSRKWTKSLWGMLGTHSQGSAESAGNEARPGTSDDLEAAAPRKSLTMHRYHTEDDTNSLSSTATRKTLFNAGEEPKQSIAARKAALFANVSNKSAPATPQGGRAESNSKPHRLVGRLMNAFTRPVAPEPPHLDTVISASDSSSSAASSRASRPSIDEPTPRTRTTTIDKNLSNFQRLRAQAKPQPVFPVTSPAPPALSTSPELSMLLCYQYPAHTKELGFPTVAYLTAFHRLQALRFLADQRREHMTFASPCHGISASGDLLPFVGVQKTSLPPSWSAISSRSPQQIQAKAQAGINSVQLLSYELLSGDVSTLGLCREEVAFYQRLSNSRDVPLGQVIEELGIRACALEADRDAASKVTDSRIVSGKANKDQARDDASAGQRTNATYGMPEQRLQFIHGSCRVRIVATLLPSRLYEVETEPQRDSEPKAGKALTDGTLKSGSAAILPPLKPTRSRESDVSAIATASLIEKEAATTAFAVAETAVQAAESGTLRPLVDQRGGGSTSGLWMWNASATSGWQGKAMPMSESTYLLSFARYLEAICYHPALRRAGGLAPANPKAYGGLSNVQRQLRQGLSEDARSVAEGPNLLRFFRSGRSLVKVQVQPIVLYDLHIEGPSLKTGSERRRERKQRQSSAEKRRFKQLAEDTRLEIQRFFASIKSVTTKLEDIFVSRELDEAGMTIRRKSGLPAAQTGAEISLASSSSSTISGQVAELLNLLTNLRTSLRSDEFELYEALQRTFFLDGINDVRKAFADRAKSAKNRLAAWTKKHLTKKEQAEFGSCSYEEPEYLQAGRRAYPGSCYIIRDDEPLSIIAFSLSSRDFRTEIGTLADRRQEAAGYMGSSNEEHVRQWRTGVGDDGDATTIGSYISSSAASTTTAASSLLKDRSMRKVPMSQLDPDVDDIFFDAEPVRTAMKRKKHGRESSILSLTLRRVGSTISEKQGISYRTMNANGRSSSSAGSFNDHIDDDDKDDDDDVDDEVDEDCHESNSIVESLKDGQDTTLGARRTDRTPLRRPSAALLERTTPSSSKPSPSRPDLRTSGSVSALRRTFELRSQPSVSSIPDRKSSKQQQTGQSAGISTTSSTSTDTKFHAQITPMSGRPASLASIFSSDKTQSKASNSRISDATRHIDLIATQHASPRGISTSPSPGCRSSAALDTSSVTGRSTSSGTSPSKGDGSHPHKLMAQPSSAASEGVTGAGADTRSMISNSTLPSSHAAESPHIKHTIVHGTTKISCVSWFAEEFAALRERWGVEHDFAHSLSRCQPWVTNGGKSKSAFFKTADERFVAKQLLTVWSVDEKEAFLEFAPAYIRYMMNSAVNDCPTLLNKIAGVYSIKIKDTKSGETKLKTNVMLLENLWAGDGGKSIRFDLKGIPDRKVKLSAQQQNLQTTATSAATTGQLLVDLTAVAQDSHGQGSVTAAWNAGMQSAGAAESGGTEKGSNSSSGAQTSANRGSGDTSNKDSAATAGEAKPSSGSSAVWWDSEWIERYRSRAFVPETQKEVFVRALQNDTQFLTASNVMDYSLLLGVMERPIRQDDMYPPAAPFAPLSASDHVDSVNKTAANENTSESEQMSERPWFRCRIVDFLGAFTLAKQLESSSKKVLKGQDAKGNVTILPPSEYASRFRSAMDSYFIGTPCQPRLDARYGFDLMCEEVATKLNSGDNGGDSDEEDPVRRPRLASVL
ncbi:related to phosphatidylinositol 3-phosphate 5-kinase [Melanopsichium pennsylvanicum]|uniref:Related to phosphatidylinositol 3-phosphate 5-kinase n=2 Tax=Melanopsichium pennsylvanicum TaxID=63383 RepID=A0AAJ4XSU6_9BASI|nr:related to phosphatidylinositol 3-phosphate 5-kinase [Melanopsichium pennsylvanicum 4]SNX88009.1 related to phosphatidylinositol 3-phosphate 5-kinase [Melanopsichium pennsylvanicum]